MKIKNIENFNQFKDFYNNDNFDNIIINISASWCKPCIAIKKELHEFIENFENNKCIFLKIDYDIIEEDEDFQEYFEIKKIPYFFIYNKKSKIREFQTGNIEIIKTEINNDVINNNDNSFNLSVDF